MFFRPFTLLQLMPLMMLMLLLLSSWVASSGAFPAGGGGASSLSPHALYGGSMLLAAAAVRRPAPATAVPAVPVTVSARGTGGNNRWSQRLALTMRRSSYGGGRSNKGDRSGGRGPGTGAMRAAPSGPFGIALTATNALLGLNAAVFLAAKQFPALVPALIKADRMISRGQTYRLATALFLHSSLYHIMTNCYSLYQIGPMAERIFGPARFVAIYMASGVLANVATVVMKSSPLSLGASGCTFGLVGAFAAYFYRNRGVLGGQSSAALESIKRTLFINMMYGAAMPGIDNAAHVGGFLSGAAVSYLFGPRLLLEKRNGRTVRIDRPMIDWGKGWRRFMKSGFGGAGGDRDGEEMRRRPARDPMTED